MATTTISSIFRQQIPKAQPSVTSNWEANIKTGVAIFLYRITNEVGEMDNVKCQVFY
jgi:hypothetical protein